MNNNDRTDIYGRCWPLFILLLGCVIFIAYGWFTLTHPYGRFQTWDIIVAYASFVLFGGGFIIILIMIINCLLHRPIAKIYDNRIEYFMPFLNKYKPILFLDVESFSIFDFELSIVGHRHSIPKMIVADRVKREFLMARV